MARTLHGPLVMFRTCIASDHGQAVLEFALTIPLLIVLVLGIVDLSLALRARIILLNAVRDGARHAAVGNPSGDFPTDCTGGASGTVIGRVCANMRGLPRSNLQSVDVTYPNGFLPGNSVVVGAQYRCNFMFLTRLGRILPAAIGGGDLDISATADMRLE